MKTLKNLTLVFSTILFFGLVSCEKDNLSSKDSASELRRGISLNCSGSIDPVTTDGMTVSTTANIFSNCGISTVALVDTDEQAYQTYFLGTGSNLSINFTATECKKYIIRITLSTGEVIESELFTLKYPDPSAC